MKTNQRTKIAAARTRNLSDSNLTVNAGLGLMRPTLGIFIRCYSQLPRGVQYYGQIAQSVEQRIENPRVGGSIPPLATTSDF